MIDNNNTTKYRIEQLEKNYEKLDKKIDELLTNHLPHIQADIMALKTRQNVTAAINIGAIAMVWAIMRFLG